MHGILLLISNDAIVTVFLDCWRKQYVNGKPIARCALYVRDHDGDDGSTGNIKRMKKNKMARRYITRDFDIRNPETGRVIDSYDDFFLPSENSLSAAASTLANANNDRYLRIEDIDAWSKGLEPAGTIPQVGWKQ